MSYDWNGVPRDYVTLTKSDTVDDPGGPFRGLWIEAAGAVKVRMSNGQDRTINVTDFQLLLGEFKRVWSTGTTATVTQGVR